jgi:hypothetical protein
VNSSRCFQPRLAARQWHRCAIWDIDAFWKRREFGMTPSARLKVHVDDRSRDFENEIGDAIWNRPVQRLIPPVPN